MTPMTWGLPAAAALLAVTMIAAPRAADAAIYLSLPGSPDPVVDLDGVTGLADIVAGDFSTLVVDVRYSSFGGADPSGGFGPGVIWGAIFGLADPFETIGGSLIVLPPPPPAPGLIHLGAASDGFGAEFTWEVAGGLLDGTLLQSFLLTTSDVGIWPHDDIGDLFLTGGTPAGGAAPLVFDPIGDTFVPFVNYDLQNVPIPAPAGLLLIGLAGLAGLRRRR